MRSTPSRWRIKPLKSEARAEDGETSAWQGDLNLWESEVGRHGRGGPKTYTYWMASWREDGRVRNVYMGSTRKMDAEAALQKVRAMKAEML